MSAHCGVNYGHNSREEDYSIGNWIIQPRTLGFLTINRTSARAESHCSNRNWHLPLGCSGPCPKVAMGATAEVKREDQAWRRHAGSVELRVELTLDGQTKLAGTGSERTEMNSQLLKDTVKLLFADHKGLLAMDESTGTCNKRFEKLGIPQTVEARRAYRELIVTTPGLSESIGGAILYDETKLCIIGLVAIRRRGAANIPRRWRRNDGKQAQPRRK